MGSSADGESSVSGPGGGSPGFRTSRDSGEDPVGGVWGGEGSCLVLPVCLPAR